MTILTKTPLAVAVLLASVAHAADDQVTLSSVVVTGQKTERSLQDTVDSVKIIDAEQIADERLTDIYDTFDRTPNVTPVTGTGNSFTIRGIDALGVSGGGNSYLASMYLDGAPLSYRALKQGTSVWDVAQVEVLRGPQSTLQGRNALAGAVIIRTEDPTYDWDAKARLIAGSHGRKELAAAAGGALIEDQLAFRIAAEERRYDGYIDNPNRSEHADYRESADVRAKVLFEPRAVSGLKILYTHSQNNNEVGVPWQSLQSKDRYDDPQVFFNDRTRETLDGRYNILDISYQLSPNLVLNAITSHSDIDYHYDWDGDAGADQNLKLIDDRDEQTLTQEVRLNFDFERVSGVFGAYYSDQSVKDVSSGDRLIQLSQYGISGPGLVALGESQGITLDLPTATLLANQYPEYAGLDYGSQFEVDVATQALFSDLTFALNDRIDLLAGIRYDREKQENESEDVVAIASQLPDPAAVGAAVAQQTDAQTGQLAAGAISLINGRLLQTATDASVVKPRVDKTFSAWLPKIGATYHFSDAVSSSLVVQKAYRSGGVGQNLAQGKVYSYDPEYVTNYEWAVRSLWLDGRLAANTNVFYLDWQDQQVSIQGDAGQFDTETVNAGESTVKGAELELLYFDANFNGYFGLGHSQTEFTRFTEGDDDLKGRAFANAPEWTANLGGSYRMDNGFVVNANANYQDTSYVRVNPNLKDGSRYDPRNDARTVVNASLGYEWDHVTLTFAVDNIFDREYVQAASKQPPGSRNASEVIGLPRSYSLSLQASMW